MLRKVIILNLIIALLLAAGCSGRPAGQGQPSAGATSQAPASQQQENAENFYAQIQPGMTYDEVMSIMGGRKPFNTSEGTIDTPMGKITVQTVTWSIGKSLLIVDFENGKVTAKHLSK